MSETTHTESNSPYAAWLGSRSLGYTFAYFAFVRGIRCRMAANNGSTFFFLFASYNPLLSDEDVSP